LPALQPDAPQGINVRQLVVDALEVAKRIPAAPPVPEDYDSLSRNIQECITELEVTTTEIVTVVEEVEAEWQANEAERAAMEEDIYDETYNRLDFNRCAALRLLIACVCLLSAVVVRCLLVCCRVRLLSRIDVQRDICSELQS
jgi:hypothetical protein